MWSIQLILIETAPSRASVSRTRLDAFIYLRHGTLDISTYKKKIRNNQEFELNKSNVPITRSGSNTKSTIDIVLTTRDITNRIISLGVFG